jgi:hypothetical protein
LAAKAAHALALATMMSTPCVLSGDVDGMKMSGAASVTLADAGNEMTLDIETLLALIDTELLHIREVLAAATEAAVVFVHEPRLAAVVPGALKQRQAVQPAVCTADEEQQHPPRQRFVPQSNEEEQESPGFCVRQAPL